MKRLYFVISILGWVSLPITAQSDYLPLVQENAHWRNCVTTSELIWDCHVMYDYHLRGDTLVDGQVYKKLYREDFLSNGEPGGSWSSYDWPLQRVSSSLLGLLREDILARKVYWRTTSNYTDCGATGEEVLLYDFDLEVGDTLQSCLATDFGTYTVSSIYTETLYGAERKVYEIDSGIRLIEGIGHENSLLSPPEISISMTWTNLFDYCTGPDMDCGVVNEDDMINPYREWHLLNSPWFVPGDEVGVTTEHRLRDTIQHGGHTYFRLQSRGQDEDGPLEWVFTEYAYRQEGDLVYRYPRFYWQPEEDELLLYDFSIDTIGATFSVEGMLQFLSPMVVWQIDTVVLDNGAERRRIHFRPEEFDEWEDWFWIEGIGANDHPFFPDRSFEENLDGPRIKTQCFFVEPDLDDPVWRKTPNSNCIIYIVDTAEPSAEMTYQVFPNPTTAQVEISNINNGEVAELYSTAGLLIGRVKASDENRVQFSLATLPAGLYIWKVLSAEGQLVQSGKLVKQ